jgi:hypothetical protein
VETSTLTTMQDANWAAANQASAKLTHRTGQHEVGKELDAITKASTPVKKAPAVVVASTNASKKRSASASASIMAAPPKPSVMRDREEAVPLPIVAMEKHTRRDEQAALFALAPIVVSRPVTTPTTEMISAIPDANSILHYCALYRKQHEDEEDLTAWLPAVTQGVSNTPGRKFPKIAVFTRSVYITFYRQPHPSCPWERPCFNLDHDPLPFEKDKLRCIAHRLSEARFGPGKGYRLREIIYPETMVKINEHLRNGTNPNVELPTECELCYMCHVWLTSEYKLTQQDMLARAAEPPNLARPPAQQKQLVRILNKFMVDIDKPGEYDIHYMLTSHDVCNGIWGPFPQWNVDNWIPCKIIESGVMVRVFFFHVFIKN